MSVSWTSAMHALLTVLEIFGVYVENEKCKENVETEGTLES